MNQRPLRSAIVLSLGALLAVAGAVAADTMKADGDGLTTTIDVGAVAPGAVLTVDVNFVLTCASSTHVDAGQTVTAGIDSAVAPLDGAVLSVTDGTVGPVTADWPGEGVPCAVPAQTFSTGTPSVVTLQAPTTPGLDYGYSLMYHRSIFPFGVNDANAVRTATAVDIVLDVVVNTPPSLTLPTVAGGGAIEANTTGGWTADWAGLGATDTEDDPDPTASCTPAAGTVLALGTTSVTCDVTDSGHLTASATFDVNVADTNAPTLTGLPADQNLMTGDPTGTTLTYVTPGATDIADAAPTVSCSPASGSHLGPGTTTVTCSATDASDNSALDAFDVTVTYVAPHTASATWGEPVDGTGSTFVANRGRTIPVKVELFVDGVARTTGDARLTVTPCEGGSPVSIALAPSTGRWNASLDTTGLVGSCHTVVASIDGLEAGAFRLEFRGTEPTKTKTPAVAATALTTPAEGPGKPDKAAKEAAKETAKAARDAAKEAAKAARELAKAAKVKQ
jgi:HYR domain